MTVTVRPKNPFGTWLRRHSLTLVAALGGAAGVAYGAGWHAQAPQPAASAGLIATSAPTPTPATPERDTAKDTVQIALLLDTSSSMDGLINQARSHLWTMVDQMGRMTREVNGKTRGVKVELALYEYGNDTLPRTSGHIRQVIGFTTDLDKVSEKLHALFTNGGAEFVGQAIQTSVNELQWSTNPDTMKFVFVAGNEEFDQGPIGAQAAMQAAAAKGISVQLIYCGGTEPTWDAAAKLAATDLMTIDQNAVAQHIPAPQDDEILRLGNELNSTYLAYGAEGQASLARQSAADASSMKMSKKVAIERAQLKRKKAAYDNDSWDLVDAVDKNGRFLETAKDEQLPAAMRGKTLEEKKQIVADNAAKRAELQARIGKLEAERNAFLAGEQAKRKGEQAQSLESELMRSTKKTAAKKGYKF
ncbi:MAG: VWA domain-containing protein [Kofleriaceae bacterium]|nr:VWA domain-containing protein [Kofleriaceae bacterium]